MSFTISMLSIAGWIWTILFLLWLGVRLRAAARRRQRGFEVVQAPVQAVDVAPDRAR